MQPGDDRLSAVALAAAACLQRMLVPEARLSDVEVRVLPGARGSETGGAPDHSAEPGIVAALLTLSVGPQRERLVGAVRLQEDRYRSVVNAVLDAVNRRLGLLVPGAPGIEHAPLALADGSPPAGNEKEMSENGAAPTDVPAMLAAGP
jgi:hypothetical protein